MHVTRGSAGRRMPSWSPTWALTTTDSRWSGAELNQPKARSQHQRWRTTAGNVSLYGSEVWHLSSRSTTSQTRSGLPNKEAGRRSTQLNDSAVTAESLGRPWETLWPVPAP